MLRLWAPGLAHCIYMVPEMATGLIFLCLIKISLTSLVLQYKIPKKKCIISNKASQANFDLSKRILIQQPILHYMGSYFSLKSIPVTFVSQVLHKPCIFDPHRIINFRFSFIRQNKKCPRDKPVLLCSKNFLFSNFSFSFTFCQ